MVPRNRRDDSRVMVTDTVVDLAPPCSVHRLQDAAIAARSEIRIHRERPVAARRKVE
jgi:hypothetical protein